MPLMYDGVSLNKDTMLRVISFNVCYDSEVTRKESGFDWDERLRYIVSLFLFHRCDIVGLQEPFKEQLDDIKEALPQYKCFGVGWEDGGERGSLDAILYRKDRFIALEESSFFLSETPFIPSIGWDSRFPRGVIWVRLLDKQANNTFYVFNTHFDYHGAESRNKSARLLRKQISSIARNEATIITGDFNIFPELGGHKTHSILTSRYLGKKFVDAKDSSQFPHHGPTGTWSGFKEAGQAGIKPDCILVDDRSKVLIHGVLADNFDGKYPSDHLPVVADIVINQP